ncbi:hypothetical protein FHS55_000894 [Angulomicrobium tetraedrale]|uniref:DUF945 domain-containing protein n=1 Tax=Ancylobacter tetraedralis TaxID=217068 RepID=A0A839Z7V3_9HYPH|nr:hypothetical protein [Ancylobacter tetraedralis]MBB3770308.1 hypothetical protein [Ancylobacter tetraedralis]
MRKPLIIALVALGVVGIGGFFSFNLVVDLLARRQLDALFAQLGVDGIEAKRGDLHYDYFKGTFEVRGLSFSAPGQGTLTLASFRAEGLEQRPAARLFARHVELTDLAFEGPLPLTPGMEGSYRAPKVEAEGVELPAAAPKSPGRPWLVARLALEQTQADRISIPESLAITRSGAGESRVETDITHGAASLRQLKDGIITDASVEPSRFTIGGAPAYAAKGTLGRVNAHTIDVGALLTVLDPQSREAATEFRTVYGSVTIDGYAITAENGITQSWSAAEIREVAIRPASIPAEDLFALGTRLQQAGGKAPPDLEVDLLRTVAATYDGVSFTSVAFRDLAGREPDGSKAELAALTAGPLAGGRIESLALDRLKGVDASGKVIRIDRLKIGGLRPGALMDVAADVAEDPGNARAIGWIMRLFGLLDSVTIEGAEAPAPSGGEPVVVDRFALSWKGETDAIPTQVSATLRLSGPTSAFHDDGPLFALVPDGLKRASVALDIGGQWDEAGSTLTLAPLYAEVSDAFALSVKVRLKDVDDSLFSPQPDEALAGAMAANLQSIDITAIDAGIYQRKLEDAAKEQGLDPEGTRQLLAGFAELLFSATLADRPDLEAASQSFIGFLQRPLGTLALRITPRGNDALPVGMIIETLQGEDPLDLIDEINVTVIAPDAPPVHTAKPVQPAKPALPAKPAKP